MSAPLLTDKPTIKILLYTDDPKMTETDDFGEFLGLGSMIARLKAHAPTFATLSPKLVCRSSDDAHHADNKINDVLTREVQETGEPFDEIWFFGLHQANTGKFSLRVYRGGPQSELDEIEVATLKDWMEVNGSVGGGVLISGDHSDTPVKGTVINPTPACPDQSVNASFLGLGRAIGRCVPRAGLLRTWENAPTNRPIDSASTIARSGFEVDRFPQQLVLVNVNAAGELDSTGHPHPIFFYDTKRFIQILPDHDHEGAITIPDLAKDVWPTGSTGQPKPHIVATGTDQSRPEPLNIVATYNGDLADVGRVVADSSFHHYVNLNLKGFPHPAAPGSDSDQIGQFYGNLAVWLAPRSKRTKMAHAMCRRLADYTLLMEVRGDVHGLGKKAYDILSRVASPCEIHELIEVLTPDTFSTLHLSDTRTIFGALPLKEVILGHVLDSFQQEMIRSADSELSGEAFEPRRIESVINSGFANALRDITDQFQSMLEPLQAIPFDKV
jgi:hypothetical protein